MKKQSTRPVIATWYDAKCRWDMKCYPVEVVAFTDKTVTILSGSYRGDKREQRQAIVSEYSHYYSTFEEAQAALIAGCERKIAHAKEELAIWTASLAKARTMTAPEVKEAA